MQHTLDAGRQDRDVIRHVVGLNRLELLALEHTELRHRLHEGADRDVDRLATPDPLDQGRSRRSRARQPCPSR